jgi:hypothetical protein
MCTRVPRAVLAGSCRGFTVVEAHARLQGFPNTCSWGSRLVYHQAPFPTFCKPPGVSQRYQCRPAGIIIKQPHNMVLRGHRPCVGPAVEAPAAHLLHGMPGAPRQPRGLLVPLECVGGGIPCSYVWVRPVSGHAISGAVLALLPLGTVRYCACGVCSLEAPALHRVDVGLFSLEIHVRIPYSFYRRPGFAGGRGVTARLCGTSGSHSADQR